MVFRALVVATVMAVLTVSGVQSNKVGTLLQGLCERVETYESIQIGKGAYSNTQYTNTFSYLQDIQHGNTPNAARLTDYTQKINTLSFLLNTPKRKDLTGYRDAADFTERIETVLPYVCPAKLKCNTEQKDRKKNGKFDPEEFRTFNGVCNNWDNPLWGAAFTHQERLNNVRGSWERTALQDYTLNKAGFLFDTRRIGAGPAFETEPFIFKVKGSEPFQIAGFDENTKTAKTKEVVMDEGIISVDGAITSVKKKSKDTCEYEFQLGSNQVRSTGEGCKGKLIIKYYKYEFLVTLQPAGSSDQSTLEVDGNIVAKTDGHKFGSDTFSRYWMKIDKNGVQITEGTEFVEGTAFLTSNKVKVKEEETRLAIGGGASTVEFVSRDTYTLVTDNSETTTTYGVANDLGSIPFVYRYLDADTFHTMRLGVKPGKGNIKILLHGASGTVTIILDLKKKKASVEYSSTSSTITQPIIEKKNIKPKNFVTASGTVFKGYYSLWVAVLDTGFVWFGTGNQIGNDAITTDALILGETFHLDSVTVESDEWTSWVWDIERLNHPRVNSLTTGETLASALDIALLLHTPGLGESTKWSTKLTMIAMQWGQFVDHDVVATPQDSVGEHSPICCQGGQTVPDESFSDVSCFNIKVSNEILSPDELAPNNAATTACQNFVRSGHILDCGSSEKTVDDRERQQMNAITSFQDASNVYGSSEEEREGLIDPDDHALLHVDASGGQSELPLATAAGEACAATPAELGLGHGCRHAGDFRSQENSGLNAMHTLWVREHNRIVKTLRATEGFEEIDAETTFLYARQIVAAEMQVINYKEYLPTFLNKETIANFQLENDLKCPYDKKISAAMLNLFGIIYRFGHTWIPNDLAGSSTETSPFSSAIGSLPLEQNFFDPATSYAAGGSDPVMLNWMKKCPSTDKLLEDTIMYRLFANLDADSLVGANLGALNIQRGRDHGVPTYSGLRKVLNLDNVANIAELCTNEKFTKATCDSIQRVYQSIHDIDTFTSGLIESPTDDVTFLGSIANEALGTMFRNLKFGDRFWYSCYFNDEAVTELQKVTIGNILCDNVGDFGTQEVQRDMFRIFDTETNQKISCEDRPKLDLSKFVTNGGRVKGFNKNGRPKQNTKKELEELEDILELLKDLH